MTAIEQEARPDAARVLIIDDHPVVRMGLSALISRESDLAVCGFAEDTGEALQLIESTAPDVLVVDLSLKSSSGLDLIRQVRTSRPELPMLVSSMYDETLYAERSLNAGAMGYIGKEEATREILTAIRRVLGGRVYLSQQMSERLIRRMVGAQDFTHSSVDALSDRELEVFILIGHAVPTSEIADRLSLSIKTIETYRQRIKQKLGLESGLQLVRRASQWVLEESQ